MGLRVGVDELDVADAGRRGLPAGERDQRGADARPWLEAGPAVVVDHDGARFPDGGPIQQVRSTHYERYKRPEDEWLSEIVAVVRESGEHERPP